MNYFTLLKHSHHIRHLSKAASVSSVQSTVINNGVPNSGLKRTANSIIKYYEEFLGLAEVHKARSDVTLDNRKT